MHLARAFKLMVRGTLVVKLALEMPTGLDPMGPKCQGMLKN